MGGGSFRVVAPVGAGAPAANKREKVKGWEAFRFGIWQDLHTINAELADSMSASYEAGEFNAHLELGGQYYVVDFDQMRIRQGFTHTDIRLKRDENDLKVNPEDIEKLKEMGFSEDLAKKALQAQDN